MKLEQRAFLAAYGTVAAATFVMVSPFLLMGWLLNKLTKGAHWR